MRQRTYAAAPRGLIPISPTTHAALRVSKDAAHAAAFDPNKVSVTPPDVSGKVPPGAMTDDALLAAIRERAMSAGEAAIRAAARDGKMPPRMTLALALFALRTWREVPLGIAVPEAFTAAAKKVPTCITEDIAPLPGTRSGALSARDVGRRRAVDTDGHALSVGSSANETALRISLNALEGVLPGAYFERAPEPRVDKKTAKKIEAAKVKLVARYERVTHVGECNLSPDLAMARERLIAQGAAQIDCQIDWSESVAADGAEAWKMARELLDSSAVLEVTCQRGVWLTLLYTYAEHGVKRTIAIKRSWVESPDKADKAGFHAQEQGFPLGRWHEGIPLGPGQFVVEDEGGKFRYQRITSHTVGVTLVRTVVREQDRPPARDGWERPRKVALASRNFNRTAHWQKAGNDRAVFSHG